MSASAKTDLGRERVRLDDLEQPDLREHAISPAKPALGELRDRLLAALASEPGVHASVTFGFAWRASAAIAGTGSTLLERDRDERVTKIVQPDRVDPVAVQAEVVAGGVQRAQDVASRPRLAARRSPSRT